MLCKLVNGVCKVCGNTWNVPDNTKVTCGVIQKKTEVLKPSSVVWVYWAHGARSNELLYSIDLARKNLSDAHNFIVCGDRPPSGAKIDYFIPQPRISLIESQRIFNTKRFAKFVDSFLKLQAINGSSHVTDDFLWMYDDTFIVKSTSIDFLSKPRYRGKLPSSKDPIRATWREAMRRTGVALEKEGLSLLNYSTHLPVVYNKEKLKKTFERFNCFDHPRLIESLYLNEWGEKP